MAKKKKKTTAIANWDTELAKSAEESAKREASSGGGQFFSIRGGKLSFGGSPIEGNTMGVVIVDYVMENVYYEGSFNADQANSPLCYAFGRDEDNMAPYEDVAEPQADLCKDCDFNQWGSAERGRGKACKNRRRLAILPGGVFKNGRFEAYSESTFFEKEDIGYLALPPTSIAGWGKYVKKIASAIKRPPHGVFTKVSVVDDSKTMFKVTFELLDKIPNNLMPAVMERHKESQGTIEFPYSKREDEPKKGKKKKKKVKY